MALTPQDRIINEANYDINKAVKGKNLMLLVQKDDLSYVPFATATSNNLSFEKDEVDVSNKSQGGWAASLDGIKSWNLSCDCIVYDIADIGLGDLFGYYNKNCPLQVAFSPVTFTEDAECVDGVDYTAMGYFLGKARLTTLDITADNAAGTTASLSFTGVGAITYEDAPAAP